MTPSSGMDEDGFRESIADLVAGLDFLSEITRKYLADPNTPDNELTAKLRDSLQRNSETRQLALDAEAYLTEEANGGGQ
ncbi:hypothetical protein [Streptomyces sp. SID3212]|uniref:hypothetical protein n=1 Tax=Streptomyces sp. SID3212 TaxID=2690259 RepID=UPI00136BBE92|nr:hypothetical protein [Streptomyces sp. SID3212]MYV58000.1 hypothetical protein [Streptomyces sp. SID3212]